jgi:hypothetical protein
MEAQALIIYGDGYQAIYYAEKNVETTREGIKVRPILVVPSQELMERYEIKEEDLPERLKDGRYGVWVKYPIAEIDWLNRSLKGAAIFIWCGFDGKPTEIMRKSELLFEDIKLRDKIEDNQERKIAYLNQMLIDISANQGDVFKNLKEYQDILVGQNVDENANDGDN